MKPRVTIAMAAVCLCASQPALAQAPPPLHKADALFNAGRNLLDAGEYTEACPKFAEANTLAPGLGVTLFLADCYERLGKTSSSLFWFRRAVELAKAHHDKRGAVAAGRAAALVPRVPSLIVRVGADAAAQHVEVSLDGTSLPTSAWGVSAPIDPGDHAIDVKATGRVTRHISFHLAPAAETHTEAVFALEAPPPPAPEPAVVAVAPPPPAPAPPAPPAPVAPPVARRSGAYLAGAGTLVGVGAVGLGVGTALGLVAMSKLSDSNAGPCDATNHCTPAGLTLRGSAESAGNGATVAFAVGGAAVAAGILVFLVRPKAESTAPSVGVSPAFGPGGGSLNLNGAF